MTNKKNKQAKKKQTQANGVNGVTKDEQIIIDPPQSPIKSDGPSSPPPSPLKPAVASPSAPAKPANNTAQAEKRKEEGNVAFKAKRYGEAIDLYTKAIAHVVPDLNPSEPAFLTNRAASYMALKRFRLALSDCQQAATLQAESPSSKTLIRLARCQFALGSSSPALSTLRTVLALEPQSQNCKTPARKELGMEWGMARLALDKCLQSIDGEGGEIPTEWRLSRVELELARGSWEAANIAANDAYRLEPNSPEVLALRGLVFFLCGKLPQALQHVQSALRLDPAHEPAQRLRKRVKDVERLKEEGNQAFKSNRLEEAIEKYTETLERIGNSEEEGKGGQIRATLLSNRATTLVKLSRHEDALVDTEESLKLLPTSFKALRTRARINLHLEKFDAAVADFKTSIEQAGFEGSDAEVRALQVELKKAEAALKRSKTKDYYKILGIPRDCSEAEIKKGYRRESLKHHPDKGGDEEKFKLVVEANAVLSDPQRRQRYDMGEDEDGQNDSGMGGMGGMNPMDFAEVFAQMHGGGFGRGGGGGHSYSYSNFGGGPRGHSHGFHF
ncbi:hypothetical protein SERLADRAFT_440542 [Serpula lacrymans var. lacrymans S7.9]|uniref:J domain-containing protein n=1 Tax=Serpula lacrymans var. lacrymans (strain S7.9) TaxID=578457 RepID=F8P2Y9_SERL9|nr:uncharacterized protein SERLADRAFT_440542 [Serpula lacrymans var. lacrymans S7.9]EGO22521.1 hypothetical protein SERLADRAFT_440542 [Serpula lacrymans var. lacrymans S7.9]